MPSLRYAHGVATRIRPISTKAITIRTSLDNSLESFFGGVGELILFQHGTTSAVPGPNRPHEKGGSAQAVSGPARFRGRLRVFRSLRAYIESRSDRTGRRRAAAGRSGVCTRAGAGRRVCAPDKKTANLGLKVWKQAILCFSTRVEYDLPLRTQ